MKKDRKHMDHSALIRTLLKSHRLSYTVETDRLRCHPYTGIYGTLCTTFPIKTVVSDLEPFSLTEKEYSVA